MAATSGATPEELLQARYTRALLTVEHELAVRTILEAYVDGRSGGLSRLEDLVLASLQTAGLVRASADERGEPFDDAAGCLCELADLMVTGRLTFEEAIREPNAEHRAGFRRATHAAVSAYAAEFVEELQGPLTKSATFR